MAEEAEIKDLSKFVFKRTLSDSSQRKVICVEGSLEPNSSCIVLLEKKPFTEENVKKLCNQTSILKKQFINDIYGSYECFPDIHLNGIKTTIIHPATEEHIQKYRKQPLHIIDENIELYNTITLPYISKQQFSLQWVYNILEHKTEAERIVFEDADLETGFILLPDLKWDGKQIESLYLLALCNSRDIKSLRDLTERHLPLLKNILLSGTKAIKDLYNIEKSRLRIYVHYQPTFYHFHVHFTYVDYEAPEKSQCIYYPICKKHPCSLCSKPICKEHIASSISCEKSHLLSSVINNIELQSDYYRRCTLPFLIKQSDNLFQQYVKRGIVSIVEENQNSDLKPPKNSQESDLKNSKDSK